MDYLAYLAARSAMFCVRIIPRHWARRLLDCLANLVYFLDAKHRHIAQVNLRIAFPQLPARQRSRIARRSFQNTAQNLLAVSLLHTLDACSISALVEYDPENGLNNYEAARRRGEPILYLTGHFGAWELLPAGHALNGHPLSFVVRPLDNKLLDRFLHAVRERTGNFVIPKKNAARQILETLRRRGDVGVLMDLNTSLSEGIFADFFGIEASTSTALALFALRTGATVLPGYLTPLRQGRYRIKFLPPVEIVRTGDADRDVAENTSTFNRILEGIVREQPESWLWGHKRWKNQPPGAPQDLYSLPCAELDQYLLKRRNSGDKRGNLEIAR